MRKMKNPSERAKVRHGDVRQKLRFFMVLAAAILSLFTLNSCIYKSSAPLSYKDIPFKARVETFGFDTDIKATVSVIPAESGSGGEFRFDFLAPASLCGIELTVKGETTILQLGGQTFFCDSFTLDKSSGIFKKQALPP